MTRKLSLSLIVGLVLVFALAVGAQAQGPGPVDAPPGPGYGTGQCLGAFVDADGDGVCDNWVDADGDGINDLAPRDGTGNRYGFARRGGGWRAFSNGQPQGTLMRNFVDADGDGVCDNWVDADGDGINDLAPRDGTGNRYGAGRMFRGAN
ncbi:MAG: hypothetical protein D6790_11765 [Caldilineae bacterium]|nr:MAG: hypothetical protein D6790_11765 [Caldilineae bacterium]